MDASDEGKAPVTDSPAFPPLVKAMVDHLDEGIVLIDPDNRIRLGNRAYAHMLDVPIEMFADGACIMPVIRVLAERGDYGPGDPEELIEGIAARMRARTAAQGERQMVNGSIIAAEWIPLPDDWLLFRLRNITPERTVSRLKDELISTVSHELRTPLTVIVGALGLLRAGLVNSQAETAELIEVAHQNSGRLTRLVNDLLDIDKLQSDIDDFRREPTDLGALLSAAVEENRPYAEGLGIALELELPETPVIAPVDRDRMLQVMSNLLTNASKFSPGGSRVRIRLRADSGGVRISVMDDGRGMSPEFQRRLFTRFAQENRASEHGETGTGLGLAICKAIVDRHGGQIHATTREGVGSIFHVDLPDGAVES